MSGSDSDETYAQFHEAVTMTAAQLDKWLDTDESKSVGATGGSDGSTKNSPGGPESTGHASGRRIVDILRTGKADLSEDNYAHMAKVVGYVHRHVAQRPSGDITESRWRYSLMNWGHDPLDD